MADFAKIAIDEQIAEREPYVDAETLQAVEVARRERLHSLRARNDRTPMLTDKERAADALAWSRLSAAKQARKQRDQQHFESARSGVGEVEQRVRVAHAVAYLSPERKCKTYGANDGGIALSPHTRRGWSSSLIDVFDATDPGAPGTPAKRKSPRKRYAPASPLCAVSPRLCRTPERRKLRFQPLTPGAPARMPARRGCEKSPSARLSSKSVQAECTATDLDAAAAVSASAAANGASGWAWLKVVPVMLMLLLSAVAGAAGGMATAVMGKAGETRVCGAVP